MSGPRTRCLGPSHAARRHRVAASTSPWTVGRHHSHPVSCPHHTQPHRPHTRAPSAHGHRRPGDACHAPSRAALSPCVRPATRPACSPRRVTAPLTKSLRSRRRSTRPLAVRRPCRAPPAPRSPRHKYRSLASARALVPRPLPVSVPRAPFAPTCLVTSSLPAAAPSARSLLARSRRSPER